jgi:chorismate-pyruvate lyase
MRDTLTIWNMLPARQSASAVAEPARDAAGHAGRLVAQHFVARAYRPAELGDVDIEDLAPDLRQLLFSDGTVTRALEVRALRPVRVTVVDEQLCRVPLEPAECLKLRDGAEACRRRVTIQADGDPAPLVCAESLIVFDRLPAGFVGRLSGSLHGLGEALQSGGLESRRELLWFGLGSAPSWRPDGAPDGPALVRAYRVVTDGRPSMLISESFALRHMSGDALALR